MQTIKSMHAHTHTHTQVHYYHCFIPISGASLYSPSMLTNVLHFGEPEFPYFFLNDFVCPRNERSLRNCNYSIDFECPPAVIMCAYGKFLKI